MDSFEIAKDILIKLIDKDGIEREVKPDAKSYVELVCEAYKQIFQAVAYPTK